VGAQVVGRGTGKKKKKVEGEDGEGSCKQPSDGTRAAGGAGEDGDGAGVAAGQARVSERAKSSVHVPMLDARPSRPELKAGRRAIIKQTKEGVRKKAGEEKQAQRHFDEFVEEVRKAEPLWLDEDKKVCWTRKSALIACEAVGLTAEILERSNDEQVAAAVNAVLDWLVANKPLTSHPFGPDGKGERMSDRGGGGGGGAERNTLESGTGSPREAPSEGEDEWKSGAEVEGDEDGGVNSSGSGTTVEGGQGDSDVRVKEDGSEREKKGDDALPESQAKRQRMREVEGSLHLGGGRRERRVEEHARSKERRMARVQLEKSVSKVPKAAGRKAQAELDRHKKSTRKRERARSQARDLIGAALLQRRRQKAGEHLTSDEATLAAFANTLSPTKLLGAGFRVNAEQDEGLEPSEDEEALDELMEETGCDREEAREALDLSCDWTESGRPSRCKAAQWLASQREKPGADQERADQEYEDSDVEMISHQSPGGTLRAGVEGARSGQQRTSSGGDATGAGPKGGGVWGEGVNEPAALNRNPVQEKGSLSGAVKRSKEADEEELESSASSGSLGQSLGSSESGSSSSDSESGGSSSESEGVQTRERVGKRDRDGRSALSSRVASREEIKRASRYVRQLSKVLKIDASWARELYSECTAEGTTSYDGLLRFFYRREAEHAKGTQKDTTRALGGGPLQSTEGGREFNVNMPTFQLPEWGPGQPPHGGVHFSSLQRMLEAYEKYDKQTNYKTQVTFKSMVKDRLKPNFESKCKLPRTVWLPPRADDWKEVAAGRPERGGWSDLRFVRQCRKVLQPKGRTSYEVAFEGMMLKHRGNDEQLAVALDLWGTEWLAKEWEAEEQGKSLPSLKMKSYFKKAVSGVARFKRWLEGRTFTNCRDWYEVLCRKLHKSLGKSAQAAHDQELDREASGRDGGKSGWQSSRSSYGGGDRGGYGGGDRGGRGGSAYRGGARGGASGPTGPTRGSENFRIFSGDRQDARANAHTAGVGIPPHSGGVEPMNSDRVRSPERRRGNFRGVSGMMHGIRRLSSPGVDSRQVNSSAEETKEKLPKGARWHDSTMGVLRCRDPDCGTRQDVPFCQGCALHGHDRQFCFKSGEPRFNPSGYWCVNKPNEAPIEGLGRRREGTVGAPLATSRGNMMDATQKL
jgi:hypothetical protein